MHNIHELELEKIDYQLKDKLEWANTYEVLVKQIALDTIKLITCIEDDLEEYKDKGFLKHCWTFFSIEDKNVQQINTDDFIKMQKIGWRFLQLLFEKDLLTAQALVTLKNNLEILATKIQKKEAKQKVEKFILKAKVACEYLILKASKEEKSQNTINWIENISAKTYNKEYTKYIKLLALLCEFRDLSTSKHHFIDIKTFKKALKKVGLDIDEKIKIKDFIHDLLEEIEQYGLKNFNEIIGADSYKNANLDLNFIKENISSLIFSSLYEILDKYRLCNTIAKEFDKDEKKFQKIMMAFIKKLNIDIAREISLKDLSVGFLASSLLVYELNDINSWSKKLWEWADKYGISISILPRNIFKLTSRTQLHLAYRRIDDLPEEIGKLTNLTTLDLSGNSLSSLPSEIGNLKNLRMLNISKNQLTRLPDSFANLTDLVLFRLAENKLLSLPEGIGNFTKLGLLDVSENELTQIPKEIGNLTMLIKCQLEKNKLTSIPKEIGNLSRLRELNLDNNELTNLPPQIGNLKNLKMLDLSLNQLTTLPNEIGNLSNLQMLGLNSNQLTNLPPQIGNLSNLLLLSLSSNNLTCLPEEITNLYKIAFLLISNSRKNSELPLTDKQKLWIKNIRQVV